MFRFWLALKFGEFDMAVIEIGLVTVACVGGGILALVVACDLVAELWESKSE